MVDVWRIVRRIGSGGYAVVYEVEKDGQRYALKVACQPERSGDPKQTDARARREVACLQQLQQFPHPHIIRLWAQGRWPDSRTGFHYIVLDFVEGCTLAQWVEQTHPTPHEVVVLFLKLFGALEHIHARHMFHRDLSLRNILVTRAGEPVIIDFGAADYATAEELTDGPLPPGTPRIRSPEAHRFWKANQLNPEARYTFKATDDIFALGADLYDVLTDPLPTRSERRPPLGTAVLEPPTPHRLSQGRVPLELSLYAMKLIHHEPEQRPPTAKDARRPLEEFARFEGEEWTRTPIHPVASQLQPEPSEAAPVPVEAPRPPARQAWRRAAFAGMLALLGVAAALTAVVWHRPSVPALPPVAASGPEAPPSPAPSLAEKPTNHPTRLPLALPTQQEAIPSVKQPAPPPPRSPAAPPKTSAGPVRSKLKRCALLVASAAWFQAGCAGVQTRPEPDDCPEKTLQAMEEELHWAPGYQGPDVTVDVNQPRDFDMEVTGKNLFAVVKDGPITGETFSVKGLVPVGTRLDGHLWTTGDRIYGRYVRAHLPGGRIVPICLELAEGHRYAPPGLPKEEGSTPGRVHSRKVSNTEVVERWR
jgi:serine/threonine-protein kinase